MARNQHDTLGKLSVQYRDGVRSTITEWLRSYGVVADVVHSRISSRWLFWLKVWMIWNGSRRRSFANAYGFILTYGDFIPRTRVKALDTGDLVLFDRPCTKMGSLYGGFVCTAAKTVSGSPYDHIGVVVRDGKGRNVIVEASFSGVTVRELCERVKRSSASQICVRELRVQRTEEMRGEARAFVEEIQHLSYKEGGMGFLQMASAALHLDRGKERRRRMHAEMIRLSDLIERLERQHKDGSATEAKSANGANGMATSIARRDELVRRLGFSSPATRSAGRPEAASSPPPPSQGMFCSELVAALYQRLGLLDSSFPSCEDYVPADFAPTSSRARSTLGDTGTRPGTAGGHRVVLLQGAELSPGRWIRRRDSRRARSPPVPDAPAETTPRPPFAPGEGENPGTGIVAELVAVGASGYPVTPDSGGHAVAATFAERVARDCSGGDGGPGRRYKSHEEFYASVSGSVETGLSIIRGVFNGGGEGSALVAGGGMERQADVVGAVDTSQQLLADWQLHRRVRHRDSDLLHRFRCLACVCSEKLAASPLFLRVEFPSRFTILRASFGDQGLLVPVVRRLAAVGTPSTAEVEGDHAWSWCRAVPSSILMPLAVAAASTLATRSVIPRLARTRPSQAATPWLISWVVGAAAAAGVVTATGARDGADRGWRYG